MGFWAWLWIWVGLIVASLAFYALIARELWGKAKPILAELEQLASNLEQLGAAVGAEATYEKPAPAMEQDPEQVFAERAEVVRNKEKRREARARRLVKALGAIKVDESRFTNG